MAKGALAFLLVAVLSVVAVSAQSGNMLIITDANYAQTIAQNKNVILEFYTTWCPACKALEPHFAKAAATLSQMNHPIRFAKVDCAVAPNACRDNGIKYIPTLKYFASGVGEQMYCGRTEEQIVNWVKTYVKL